MDTLFFFVAKMCHPSSLGSQAPNQEELAELLKLGNVAKLGIGATVVVANPHGCFRKLGVPQNGWFIMENKIDDFGVPLFLETSTFCNGKIQLLTFSEFFFFFGTPRIGECHHCISKSSQTIF